MDHTEASNPWLLESTNIFLMADGHRNHIRSSGIWHEGILLLKPGALLQTSSVTMLISEARILERMFPAMDKNETSG